MDPTNPFDQALNGLLTLRGNFPFNSNSDDGTLFTNTQESIVEDVHSGEDEEEQGELLEARECNGSQKARISKELRDVIVKNCEENGMPISVCARILGINRTTVSKFLKVYRQRGTTVPLKTGGKSCLLTEREKELLCDKLDQDCTLSLISLQQYCLSEFGKRLSKSSLSRALNSFHYTFKRVQCIPEARLSESTTEARFQYASRMFQKFNTSMENIYFIDEVGFNLSMRCKYGWAPANQNANAVVSRLRSRNLTVCALFGVNGYEVIKHQYSGFNNLDFASFIHECFEHLRRKGCTDGIIVMDNAAIHKTAFVRNLCQEQGRGFVVEYLPPYSPFLNPIEESFSKWKQHIRRSAPQNAQELHVLVENSHSIVTPVDARSYYQHSLTYFHDCLTKTPIYN